MLIFSFMDLGDLTCNQFVLALDFVVEEGIMAERVVEKTTQLTARKEK